MGDKIKLTLIGIISTISLLGILGAFTTSFVFPNFPYKMQNISTNIKNANVNNTSIQNYLSIDKEGKLIELKGFLEQSKKNAEDSKKQLKEFSIPEGFDYGSMLIFIEQFAIKNYLQLLNIQFEGLNSEVSEENPNSPENTEEITSSGNENTEEITSSSNENTEETTETTETEEIEEIEEIEENHENQLAQGENPVNESEPSAPTEKMNPTMEESTTPLIEGLNSKKMTVKVMGPYSNIQTFLETLPNELGFFNNLNNLKIWKSTEQNALDGVNISNQYLFEDEKSVILEFDIISYHK